MLVIRLARVGRNKYPVYRIVAADSRRAATSKFVAILGNYNPHTKELVIKKEELVEFVNNGAQPSNRVLQLMEKDGMELPKWASVKTRNRAPKKEVEEKPQTAEVAADATEATSEAAVDAEATETATDAIAADQGAVDAQEAVADAAEAATDESAKASA